jgi:branched-chain amino acid transport system permease protein
MVYFFDVFQYILNGISIGSLYALVAVGYSMVFGVLKFVNFAHGEIYMIGSYLVMSLFLQHLLLVLRWLVCQVFFMPILCNLSTRLMLIF